jgi:hypothetical protein
MRFHAIGRERHRYRGERGQRGERKGRLSPLQALAADKMKIGDAIGAQTSMKRYVEGHNRRDLLYCDSQKRHNDKLRGGCACCPMGSNQQGLGSEDEHPTSEGEWEGVYKSSPFWVRHSFAKLITKLFCISSLLLIQYMLIHMHNSNPPVMPCSAITHRWQPHHHTPEANHALHTHTSALRMQWCHGRILHSSCRNQLRFFLGAWHSHLCIMTVFSPGESLCMTSVACARV